MELVICVDDTDDLSKTISTGRIAQYIKEAIEEQQLGICENITRHQLLLHRDVPYTSHNSSMCFWASIGEGHYETILTLSRQLIQRYKSLSSDPGLCIADEKRISDLSSLLRYGAQAKTEVLNKSIAYQQARHSEVFLEELGGTGQGVVGALAGVALRLSGNDGDFRGKITAENKQEITASELKKKYLIQRIVTLAGEPVDDQARIYLQGKSKIFFRGHQAVFYVKEQARIKNEKVSYIALQRDEIRHVEPNNWVKNKIYTPENQLCFKARALDCSFYESDVEEERLDGARSCLNCLYRIWNDWGICCSKRQEEVLEVK